MRVRPAALSLPGLRRRRSQEQAEQHRLSDGDGGIHADRQAPCSLSSLTNSQPAHALSGEFVVIASER